MCACPPHREPEVTKIRTQGSYLGTCSAGWLHTMSKPTSNCFFKGLRFSYNLCATQWILHADIILRMVVQMWGQQSEDLRLNDKRSHLLSFVGSEVLKFPPPQRRKSRHSPGLPAPDPSWPRCPAPREEPWPSKAVSWHIRTCSCP